MIRPRLEDADAYRDQIARRIIADESFLLALCVAIDGWTPYATLRLAQIAAAEASRKRPTVVHILP